MDIRLDLVFLLTLTWLDAIVSQMASQSYIGGTISSDRTLHPSDNPHFVMSDVIVPMSVTLQINSGVILYMNPAVSFQVYGSLQSNGNALGMVQFLLNGNARRIGQQGLERPVVRLAHRTDVSSGILKVVLNNVWVDACDQRVNDEEELKVWGKRVAKVVCRDLGFASWEGSRIEKTQDVNVRRNLVLTTHWDCYGNETSFRSCRLQRSGGAQCDPREDALKVTCGSSWPHNMHWGGITFHPSNLTSSLSSTLISHAGIQRDAHPHFPFKSVPSLKILSDKVTVSDVRVENSGGSGIEVYGGGSVTVQRVRVAKNLHNGLKVTYGRGFEARIGSIVAEENGQNGIVIQESLDKPDTFERMCLLTCTWCSVARTQGSHSYIMNASLGDINCVKTFSSLNGYILGFRVLDISGNFFLTIRDGPSVLSPFLWNGAIGSLSATAEHIPILITNSEFMTIALSTIDHSTTGWIQMEIFTALKGKMGVYIDNCRLTSNRAAGLVLDRVTVPIYMNSSDMEVNLDGILSKDSYGGHFLQSSRISRNRRHGVQMISKSMTTFQSVNSALSYNGGSGALITNTKECTFETALREKALVNINIERNSFEGNGEGGLMVHSGCQSLVNVWTSRFVGGYYGVSVFLNNLANGKEYHSMVQLTANSFFFSLLPPSLDHPFSKKEYAVNVITNHSTTIMISGNSFNQNNVSSVVNIASHVPEPTEIYVITLPKFINVSVSQNVITGNVVRGSIVKIDLQYNQEYPYDHHVSIQGNNFAHNEVADPEPYFVSTLQAVTGAVYLHTGSNARVNYNFFNNPQVRFAVVANEHNTSITVDASRCYWGVTSSSRIVQKIYDGRHHFVLPFIKYWPWLVTTNINRVSNQRIHRPEFRDGNIIGGVVASGRTESLSRRQYKVVKDIHVRRGGTLEISPGAVLLFEPGLGMKVSGRVEIRGSLARPVRFSAGTLHIVPPRVRLTGGTSGYVQVQLEQGWVNICLQPPNPLSVPDIAAEAKRDMFFCNAAGFGWTVSTSAPPLTNTAPASTTGGLAVVPRVSSCYSGYSIDECHFQPETFCGHGGYYQVSCESGPFAGIHFTAEATASILEHLVIQHAGTVQPINLPPDSSAAITKFRKVASALVFDLYHHRMTRTLITGRGGRRTDSVETETRDWSRAYSAISIKKVRAMGAGSLSETKVLLQRADVGLVIEDTRLNIGTLNITVESSPKDSWGMRVEPQMAEALPENENQIYRRLCNSNGSDIYLMRTSRLFSASDMDIAVGRHCAVKFRSRAGYRFIIQMLAGWTDPGCVDQAFTMRSGFGYLSPMRRMNADVNSPAWTSLNHNMEIILRNPATRTASCLNMRFIVYAYHVQGSTPASSLTLSTSVFMGFKQGILAKNLTGTTELKSVHLLGNTNPAILVEGGSGSILADAIVADSSAQAVSVRNFTGAITLSGSDFGQGSILLEVTAKPSYTKAGTGGSLNLRTAGQQMIKLSKMKFGFVVAPVQVNLFVERPRVDEHGLYSTAVSPLTIAIEDCIYQNVQNVLTITAGHTSSEPSKSSVSALPGFLSDAPVGSVGSSLSRSSGLSLRFLRNTVSQSHSGIVINSLSKRVFGTFDYQVINNTFSAITRQAINLVGGGLIFGNKIVSSRFSATSLVNLRSNVDEPISIENNHFSYCAGVKILEVFCRSASGFVFRRNTFERNYVGEEVIDITLLRDDISHTPVTMTLNLFSSNSRFGVLPSALPCPFTTMIIIKGTKRVTFTRNVLKMNEAFQKLIRVLPSPVGINAQLPLDFKQNYWGTPNVNLVAQAVDFKYTGQQGPSQIASMAAAALDYVPFYTDEQLTYLSYQPIPHVPNAGTSNPIVASANNDLVARVDFNASLSAGTYHINPNSEFVIAHSGVLTLLPGVVLNIGTGSSFKVFGRLASLGTPEEPVRITGLGISSQAGNNGGTNSQTSPAMSCPRRVQLFNGTSAREGILQFLHSEGGWRNVCWRDWLSLNTLTVVCRELGYSSVVSYRSACCLQASVDLYCTGVERQTERCRTTPCNERFAVYLKCSKSLNTQSGLVFDSVMRSTLRHTHLSYLHHVAISKTQPLLENVNLTSIYRGLQYSAIISPTESVTPGGLHLVKMSNSGGINFYEVDSNTAVTLNGVQMNQCEHGITVSDGPTPKQILAWFSGRLTSFSFCGPNHIIDVPLPTQGSGLDRFRFFRQYASPMSNCRVAFRVPVGHIVTLVMKPRITGNIADVTDGAQADGHGLVRRFVSSANATSLKISSHGNTMTVLLLIKETDVEYATLQTSSVFKAMTGMEESVTTSPGLGHIYIQNSQLTDITNLPGVSIKLKSFESPYNVKISSFSVIPTPGQAATSTKALIHMELASARAMLYGIVVQGFQGGPTINVVFNCKGVARKNILGKNTVGGMSHSATIGTSGACLVDIARTNLRQHATGVSTAQSDLIVVENIGQQPMLLQMAMNTIVDNRLRGNKAIVRLTGSIDVEMADNLFHQNSAGFVIRTEKSTRVTEEAVDSAPRLTKRAVPVGKIGYILITSNTFSENRVNSVHGSIISLGAEVANVTMKDNVFMNPDSPLEVVVQNGSAGPLHLQSNYWQSRVTIGDKIQDLRVANSTVATDSLEPILEDFPPNSRYSALCPSEWIQLGSRCFLYPGGSTDYHTAQLFCQQRGGDVMTRVPARDSALKLLGNSSSVGVWLLSPNVPLECLAYQKAVTASVSCNALNSYVCELNVGGTCPRACSLHGVCHGGRCICKDGWSGLTCSIPVCTRLNNCNGNGACTGPNVCSCNPGWFGKGCTTSKCNVHRSCSSCAKASGCGWCDTTRTCSPGTPNGPAGTACLAWFYHNCITMETSTTCSSEISVNDCRSKFCGNGFGSNAAQGQSVDCIRCRDLERCYKASHTPQGTSYLCFAWDDTTCPGGKVKVDYTRQQRVTWTRPSPSAEVIDPAVHTIFMCHHAFSPDAADLRKLLIVPRAVAARAGLILVSAQTGGIMHKVLSVKRSGRFQVIIGAPAGVQDILSFADFNQQLPLHSLKDKAEVDRIPTPEMVGQAKVMAQDENVIVDISSSIHYKAMGLLYQVSPAHNQLVRGYFLVAKSDLVGTRKLKPGDVVVSNQPMFWLETVSAIGLSGSTPFARTTLLYARPTEPTWRPPRYQLSISHQLACEGGNSGEALFFYSSRDRPRRRNAVPGRSSPLTLGHVRSITLKDDYYYIETLPLNTPKSLYNLDSLSTARKRRSVVLRKKNYLRTKRSTVRLQLEHTYNKILNLTQLPGLSLVPTLDIKQTLGMSLRVKENGNGQVEIIQGGISLSGDISSSLTLKGKLRPTLTSLNGVTLEQSYAENKVISKFYVDVGGVPIPGQLQLGVKVHCNLQSTDDIQLMASLKSQSTFISSMQVKSNGAVIPYHENTNLVGLNTSVHTEHGGRLSLSVTPTLTLLWPYTAVSADTKPRSVKLALLAGLETEPVTQQPKEWKLAVSTPASLNSKFTSCNTKCASPSVSMGLESAARVVSIGTVFNYGSITQELVYNPTGASFLSNVVCLEPKVPSMCCSCQTPFGGSTLGLQGEHGQCLCECFCDPITRRNRGFRSGTGACQCNKCPDGSLRRFWRNIQCPCTCPNGQDKEMSANGRCECGCQCADGSLSYIGPDGTCECSCKCNDCSVATKGPQGCMCPQEVCPTCEGGVKPIWTDCECQCPPSLCGPPNACATGRRGPTCNLPNCPHCNSCSNGNGMCLPKIGTCESKCECSARWTGECCDEPTAMVMWGGFLTETLDGTSLEYHGSGGEFWGCRSPALGFGYQLRLFRSDTLNLVLVGGLAIRVGQSVLTVSAMGKNPSMRLDGGEMLLSQSMSMRVTGSDVILSVAPSFDRTTDVLVGISLQFKSGITLMATVHYNTFGKQIYMSVSLTPSADMFGKTSGLCGIFDNDKANDLLLPTSAISAGSREFFEAWKVGAPRNNGGVKNSWSWSESNFHFLDPKVPSSPNPNPGVHVPNPRATSAAKACMGFNLTGSVLASCVLNAAFSNNSVVPQKDILQADCRFDCSGRGLCSNRACHCFPGWSGPRCTRGVCGPCMHGSCVDGFCQCKLGFVGADCSGHPSCATVNHCSNHGICSGPDTCTCFTGFSGPSCSSVASCSALSDCSGNGECINDNTCQCHFGYTGNDCSLPSCEGVGFCSKHGQCMGLDVCVCDDGWTGLTCSEPDCSSLNGCSDHGFCSNPQQCSCNHGWSGEDCSQPITCPLLSNCHGNGACIAIDIGNNKTDLQCRCFFGYEGKTCTTPSCGQVNNCSKRGVCVEPNLCRCAYGYTGKDCSTFSCESKKKCSGNGRCISFEHCQCYSMWSGASCDQPSCFEPVSSCSNRGFCVSPNTCKCYSGYSGQSCGSPQQHNQHAPIFSSNVINNITVYEDLKEGVVLNRLTASDQDSGTNGQVTYSLYSQVGSMDMSRHFIIGPRSGDIILVRTLPVGIAKKGPVVVNVEASDGGTIPKMSTVSFHIEIKPVNRYCPKFISPTPNAVVLVNTSVSSDDVIIQVEASDEDTGLNGKVQFEISSDQFRISINSSEPNTGLISLLQDNITAGQYLLTVVVTDHGSPPCSTSLPIFVLVFNDSVIMDADRQRDFMIVHYFDKEAEAIRRLAPGTPTNFITIPVTIPITHQPTTTVPVPRKVTTQRPVRIGRPTTPPTAPLETTTASHILDNIVPTKTDEFITRTPFLPTIAPPPSVDEAASKEDNSSSSSGMIAVVAASLGLLLVIAIVSFIVYSTVKKWRAKKENSGSKRRLHSTQSTVKGSRKPLPPPPVGSRNGSLCKFNMIYSTSNSTGTGAESTCSGTTPPPLPQKSSSSHRSHYTGSSMINNKGRHHSSTSKLYGKMRFELTDSQLSLAPALPNRASLKNSSGPPISGKKRTFSLHDTNRPPPIAVRTSSLSNIADESLSFEPNPISAPPPIVKRTSLSRPNPAFRPDDVAYDIVVLSQ